MLADFREYYGLRLSDVLRFDGSLPVWEAAVLAEQLPLTSRTLAALQGGVEYRGWSNDTHLLAAIVDSVNLNSFLFAKANSNKRVKEPKLVPRPGDEARRQAAKANNPFALQVNAALDSMKSQSKKVETDAKEA